jgi:6-phosphofructokinase 1
VVGPDGQSLGALTASKDPAGNVQYTGAAEAIKKLLGERIGNDFFTHKRRNESADAAIFVRKVGHTQRGGRPILFDRFHATQLGGEALDLLAQGYQNCIATLQYRDGAYRCEGVDANKLRDRWGTIHARPLASAFYDPKRFQPSAKGIEYLDAIFANALGAEDLEDVRSLFHAGRLTRPYHSVNVDINKRIRRIDPDA